MNALKLRLEKLLQKVDRLSLRERLFLFAALLAVMSGGWEALLATPLDVREQSAGDRINSLQERLGTLNESIAVAAEGMNQEDMPIELDRLNTLRERVAKGDNDVKLLTSDLVDPKQMRSVLEELIRRQSGLRLISATNLAPSPLFEDATAEAEAETTEGAPISDAPKIFRHTLVLRLEGSYLDCLAYLQAIERLPWHLYWGRIEVEMGTYPKNAIVIELRTLSLDQEWIGV
jgi:MSHA biogenesis protein MshJ